MRHAVQWCCTRCSGCGKVHLTRYILGISGLAGVCANTWWHLVGLHDRKLRCDRYGGGRVAALYVVERLRGEVLTSAAAHFQALAIVQARHRTLCRLSRRAPPSQVPPACTTLTLPRRPPAHDSGESCADAGATLGPAHARACRKHVTRASPKSLQYSLHCCLRYLHLL